MRKKIDLRAVINTAPKPEANTTLTFAELLRAWNATTQNADDMYRLRKWVEAFGDRVAWSLTTDEIVTAAAGMIEHGYAPGTVNRDVGCIGSAFRWIVCQRRAPAGFVSPTLSIRRYPEAKKTVEISPEQIERLRALGLTYSNKRFPIFVALLIDSGARKGELYPRTWGDVDLDRRRIVLEPEDTKTRRARTLFFSEATAALIRRFVPERDRKPDALLFPGRDPREPINFRTSWAKLTRDAGLPDLGMHGLRHNRARELLLAGVPISQAAQILGHSVQVLEARYGTLAVDDKQAAAERTWGRAA